jgi:hypothetical protein
MPQGEVNYVHEQEIWRGQMKTEVESAATWHENWGFLTGKEQSEPRGFTTKVAKYAYGAGNWSVKQVRVPDNSEEGIAAAVTEQEGRKLMPTLEWTTTPDSPVKPCAAKGVTLVKDTKTGVEGREAALLMRSHKFQTLGDACLTEGVDPGVKYHTPVITSHEYGWRAPTSSNTRPPLEKFGVSDFGRKQVVRKFVSAASTLQRLSRTSKHPLHVLTLGLLPFHRIDDRARDWMLLSTFCFVSVV